MNSESVSAARGTKSDVTSRWLTGTAAKVWCVLTGRRARSRVQVDAVDLKAAASAASVAALRPDDGLAAIVALDQLERLGLTLLRFRGDWTVAAGVLEVIVDVAGDEEHDRLMREAARLADEGQGVWN